MAWEKSDFQALTRINGEVSKLCSGCHEIKPLVAFSDDSRQPTGKQARCRKCVASFQKSRRTKEGVRASNFKYNYGITLEGYQSFYDSQEGKCKICDKWFEKLFVDHCHNTKIIRGLLCGNCNIGIGNLQHDEVILENAIKYLRRKNGSSDK